jgi:hypothetical protein
MAKIIINNEVRANGKLSATRTLNEEKNGFIISGAKNKNSAKPSWNNNRVVETEDTTA